MHKTKTCRTCRTLKVLRAFYKHPHTLDGRESQCKVCKIAAVLARRKALDSQAKGCRNERAAQPLSQGWQPKDVRCPTTE